MYDADRTFILSQNLCNNLLHKFYDSIVRQMVECIKVYANKYIEVIFGGGYAVEETVE